MWIGNYSKWFSCTTPTPDAPSALPTSIKSPCYIGCPKRGHGTPGIPSTCSKHSAISSHTDRFYSLSQGMLSAVISSMIQPEERSDRLLLLLLLYTYSFTGPLKLIGRRNWKQAGLCCPWLKKRKHPSFAAMITETKQLCPSCLPCVTEKHRVKAKFLTHLDSFSQTYIPNHYLTAPELSLLITKKGTRRLKGKSHEEMRNES